MENRKNDYILNLGNPRTNNRLLNVLVMGRSGAGKSTLINSCFNLAANRDFTDERRFGIPINFAGPDGKLIPYKVSIPEFQNQGVILEDKVGGSDTKHVTFYPFDANGVRINLIDTPGFGDTRGPKQDEINAKIIVQEVGQIAQIHAILWVCKGDENRMTMELKYCIEQFKGMLTDDYKDNVFACFTHVTSPTKIDAKAVLAELKIPLGNFVYFENSCLMPVEVLKLFFTKDCQDELEDEIDNYKQLWKKNKRSFNSLIETFSKITPCSSKPMVLLHQKRRLIEIMLLSYSRNTTNIVEAQYKARLSMEQLKVTKDLVKQNTEYEKSVEEETYLVVKKKFLGIIPYTKKKKVVLITKTHDAEMKRIHDQSKNLEAQLNIDLKKLASEQAKYSADIENIKGPIHYIVEMIKKKAMSGQYRNTEAKNILADLIEKIKQTGSGELQVNDLKEQQETLDKLNEVDKLLDQNVGTIKPDVLQKIIHFSAMSIVFDAQVSSDEKKRAIDILKNMKLQFNPQSVQELNKLGQSFEKSFDSFLDAAFMSNIL